VDSNTIPNEPTTLQSPYILVMAPCGTEPLVSKQHFTACTHRSSKEARDNANVRMTAMKEVVFRRPNPSVCSDSVSIPMFVDRGRGRPHIMWCSGY